MMRAVARVIATPYQSPIFTNPFRAASPARKKIPISLMDARPSPSQDSSADVTDSQTDAAPLLVTGLGHALRMNATDVDSAPFLKKGLRKLMGAADDLTVIAAGAALQSAGLLSTPLSDRMGLYLALGVSRFEGRHFVAENFDIKGPHFVTGPGPGQFYLALEQAWLALRTGAIDAALVGGVTLQLDQSEDAEKDAPASRAPLAPVLRGEGRGEGPRVQPLPKPVLSEPSWEAAGCLVLERADSARERFAEHRPPPAQLVDFAIARQTRDSSAPESPAEEQFIGLQVSEAGPGGPASLPFALSRLAAYRQIQHLEAIHASAADAETADVSSESCVVEHRLRTSEGLHATSRWRLK